MKSSSILRRARVRGKKRGFTLIELLAVITIILLLGTFASPVLQKILAKADSQTCASNLRAIGIAVQLAVQDNNGFYPNVEPDPTQPIYLPEDNAQSLMQLLEPYDVTGKTLKCPSDLQNNNYYAQKGTSYEWRPTVDGEPAADPKLIFRRGIIIKASPSRIQLVTDFDAVHNGRLNGVYADGHVKVY